MGWIRGVEGAKKAYLDSAYYGIELDMERRINKAGNPIWGGTRAIIAGGVNRIVRPLAMLKAYTVGTDNAPYHLKTPVIPEDIADSRFAEDLQKSAALKREVAEHNAEKYGALLNGDLGGYWRHGAAARHARIQEQHVVMPEDTSKGNMLLMGALALPQLAGISESIRSATVASNALGMLTPHGRSLYRAYNTVGF